MFGNIASNAGAIKSFLPGLVSGGLNSAFNGGNFLGGAIAGMSYSGNLFTNKVTSTDGINAGYKYIISPDYNDSGNGFNDFGQNDPAAFWFFDKKGEELLNHWLGGSGKNLSFIYDKGWSDYMKSNGILLERLQRIARSRSYLMNSEGKTKYSETSGNFHFEIDDGYNTGYKMLHGTNYLSYIANGRYDKSSDSYIFKFNLKWTDHINHNSNILMDRAFNSFTRAFAHPADYWITIKWTQTIIIKNKEWERLH